MLGKFWESAGDKIAERWLDISMSALVFWLGGLIGWIYSRGGLTQLANSERWLTRLPTAGQVAVLLVALAGVAGSGVVVSRLSFPVLQVLEGDWPGFCAPLRRLIMSRLVEPLAKREEERRNDLAQVVLDSPAKATAEQLARYARAELTRRRLPPEPAQYMPTRTGNILRAAEAWPDRKYGLNSVIVWPRLWLLLPDSVREELAAARAGLDSAVSAVVWGLLFCLFAFWTPCALLIGLLVAIGAAAFWVPSRAETFGDLMEAAYDLYRISLYQQLRWPLPQGPDDEVATGKALTEYLWRGTATPAQVFAQPTSDEQK
jgi:hypothetical protein